MPAQKPNILAVDDEVQTLHLVRRILELEGYRVITAGSGEAALDAFQQQLLDLVVLDIMMPGIDGYDVCRRIRSFSQVPIIMLTAKGSDEEKVKGLDAGADDYMTKPFSTKELLARVRAMLRRTRAIYPTPACATFKSDQFEIDFARRRVTVAAKEVSLTPTEFCLLQELVLNAGKVLTHTHLLRRVWGPEYRDERQYLHVFMGHLRAKLKLETSSRKSIENVTGVGYRYNG